MPAILFIAAPLTAHEPNLELAMPQVDAKMRSEAPLGKPNGNDTLTVRMSRQTGPIVRTLYRAVPQSIDSGFASNKHAN